MRWLAFSSVAALLFVTAPAGAAVRVGDGGLLSLTEWRGAALGVVESGDVAEPFELVRSSGRGRSLLGSFGAEGAEFPDVAAAGERAYVTWGVPISGGESLTVATLEGERFPEVVGTGPGRLAVGEEGLHLAYPDRDGNATVATLATATERRAERPSPQAITTTAPFRRHLPLGVAAVEGGALVLDLIQERDRTELRVLGPGAPSAPILSVRALRHFPARLAVRGDRIAVAWLDRGRARLAVASLGGTWSRRSLPGRGGGDGAPAPAFAGRSLRVAYTQRGDVYVWRGGTLRRLTRTPSVERDAFAAGPFVGWTRRDASRNLTAWLERIG